MLSRLAARLLPEPCKRRIKSIRARLNAAYVRRFRSYDDDQLLAALRALGASPGTVLMVHSAYAPFNGFRGSPGQILATFESAITPDGTLLMPSAPYTGSTEEYLRTGPTFDVRRTPSQMGILSELFRRQEGTLRSRNPAHPVLARGPLAAWFVAGHEHCPESCGAGTPFERLIETNANVLLFDVDFIYLTFFHHLEHLVREALPFPLYDEALHAVRVRDEQGRETTVAVRTFTQRIRAARRFSVLERELRRRGLVRSARVGNTRLSLVAVRDTVAVTRDLAGRGRYFYDFDS